MHICLCIYIYIHTHIHRHMQTHMYSALQFMQHGEHLCVFSYIYVYMKVVRWQGKLFACYCAVRDVYTTSS